MVNDENKLILKPVDAGFGEGVSGGIKELLCLMDYKLVLNIIFILKIQIKGALCNSGLFYNIRDGGGVDAFCCK